VPLFSAAHYKYSLFVPLCFLAATGCCIFFAPSVCAASEEQPSSFQEPGLQNALIVSTVKTLAKAFISTQEKDQLMKKIEILDDKKFSRKYNRVYRAIQQYPRLTAQYGLKEHMSKEEFIREIRSWDKNKMFSFVNAVPDTVVLAETKHYLSRNDSDQHHADYIGRICQIWDDALGRAGLK
jgi:hypothetical protein